MEVKIIPCLNDNYSYLIFDKSNKIINMLVRQISICPNQHQFVSIHINAYYCLGSIPEVMLGSGMGMRQQLTSKVQTEA